MIGRVLLRLPAAVRLPTSTSSHGTYDLPIRILSAHRRAYATPGRPRSVVGEPSTAVRRAAKRSAAKATSSSDSPAKKKNESKKKAAAKKPAAKKVAPKKPVKVLTEEQKAAKAARSDKAEVALLKKAALNPPHVPKNSAYNEYYKDKAKGVKPTDGQSARENIGQIGKQLAGQWKELAAADIEHYNHLAHKTNEAAAAEFKRWVESHTPEQIAEANRARANLRRKLVAGKGDGQDAKLSHNQIARKWPDIKDERAAKRPLSAFFQFSVNRQHSGDFKNIHVTERAKLIAQEWKALSEDEKKKYKTLQAEDFKRYEDEFTKTYGHPPPYMTNGHQEPAIAAAAA